MTIWFNMDGNASYNGRVANNKTTHYSAVYQHYSAVYQHYSAVYQRTESMCRCQQRGKVMPEMQRSNRHVYWMRFYVVFLRSQFQSAVLKMANARATESRHSKKQTGSAVKAPTLGWVVMHMLTFYSSAPYI